MNQTDAYAAGLVDGEGAIGIHKYPKARNYYPFLSVEMSEKADDVIRMLHREYGGHINKRTRGEQNATTSVWRLRTASDLRACLDRILPHLILKSEQASIAMKLLDAIKEETAGRPRNNCWTDELRERAEVLYRRIRELNLRGPVPERSEGWFARLVAGIWVTPQRDLFTDLGWEQYSETWPHAGMTVNGIAFRRRPLAPRTSVTECSLWPTPVHKLGGGCALDGGSNSRKAAKARGMWPTPRANERGNYQYDNGDHSKPRLTLTGVVKRWPTPAARDYRNQHADNSEAFLKRQGQRRGVNLVEECQRRGEIGQLNPTWVEWLMGFPLGWTDLEDSATPSSRK